MSGATLDEQVAMVCDLLEDGTIDGTPAVTLLREKTGLDECIAGGLLRLEMCRRRQTTVHDVLRDVRREDGTWSP